MNIKKILSNTIFKELYLLLTAPIDSPVKEPISSKRIKHILDNLIVGKMKGGKYVTYTSN